MGGFLGHVLAIRRGKIQSRHNASIELKKAFRRCALQIENGENPTIMISAEYQKQHEAAMEYSATLMVEHSKILILRSMHIQSGSRSSAIEQQLK